MPTNLVEANQFAIHENPPGAGPVFLTLNGSPSVARIEFVNNNPVVTMTITVQFNPEHFGPTDLSLDPHFHNIIDFGSANILSSWIQVSTESSGENTVFHIGTLTTAIESKKDKFGGE